MDRCSSCSPRYFSARPWWKKNSNNISHICVYKKSDYWPFKIIDFRDGQISFSRVYKSFISKRLCSIEAVWLWYGAGSQFLKYS